MQRAPRRFRLSSARKYSFSLSHDAKALVATCTDVCTPRVFAAPT
jgi:hypothetical protein